MSHPKFNEIYTNILINQKNYLVRQGATCIIEFTRNPKKVQCAKKSEIRQLNVTRCKMLNEEALRVLETLDGWVQLLPLHIYQNWSSTFENVRSQTFQSINPFKQFSGSHWGRSNLKPRSKERVWPARKVPLFTHNLVS